MPVHANPRRLARYLPASCGTRHPFFRMPMLYQAYQFQSDLMSPLRLMAQHLSASLWLKKT